MNTVDGNTWQRSEVREVLMLEMIHDGVTIRDSDGRLVKWNRAAEQMLGLTPEQISDWDTQNPDWEVVHPDGSPFTRRTWPGSEAQRTGEAVRDVIMGFLRPPSARLWLRVNSTPFVEADGSVSATITTFTDVTAIIDSEQDTTNAAAEASSAPAVAEFDRHKLELSITAFDNALARMTATLDDERETMRTTAEGIRAGRSLSQSLDEKRISSERDNLTSAIVELEGARRAIRVQMFRAFLAEGKSIGDIARMWGISRQLASRILREAKETD